MRPIFDLDKHWKRILLNSIVPLMFLFIYIIYSLKLKMYVSFSSVPESSRNLFIAFYFFFMAFTILICLTIGFSWSKKYGLIGWKGISIKDKIFWEVMILGLGSALILYLLIDRVLFENMKTFWPDDWLDVFMKQLRLPLILEIVLRFGLVTLIYRLNKNAFRAVIYVAVFYAVADINSQILHFGLELKTYTLLILTYLYFFIRNSISGYIYVKGGIYYSMLFQFIIGIR